MKQSELEKKLRGISSAVRRAGIVPNAIKVAEAYGKGKITTHDAFCNHNYTFKGEIAEGLVVSIRYNDGLTMFGGGELEIMTDKDGVVFSVDRYAAKKPNFPVMEEEGWGIEVYKPGNWAKKLAKYAKKGPKVEVAKPEEKEVSPDVLADLKSRLPL